MSTTEKKTKTAKQPTRKEQFIRALAEYLVGDQVRMSIRLQAGSEDAKTWAHLRGTTPLFGYPTVKEAETKLTEFLA